VNQYFKYFHQYCTIGTVMATIRPGRAAGETLDMDLDPTWSIGHMFGGATAASMLRASASGSASEHRAPLTATFAFSRPVHAGRRQMTVVGSAGGRRFATTVAALLGDGDVPAVTGMVVWGPADALPVVGADSRDDPPHVPPSAEPAAGDLSAMVDWRLEGGWPGSRPSERRDGLRAWIRPRGRGWTVQHQGRVVRDPAWYLVASDLLGPALLGDAVPQPFRVATVALEVSVHALTASDWLEQRVTATIHNGVAVGRLELRTPDGSLVGTAVQHAVLLPATLDDLPVSVTGFGWGGPAVPPIQDK
jgi:Thioesterase-like superfamily